MTMIISNNYDLRLSPETMCEEQMKRCLQQGRYYGQ